MRQIPYLLIVYFRYDASTRRDVVNRGAELLGVDEAEEVLAQTRDQPKVLATGARQRCITPGT